jgi:hypothetical protein
MSTSGTYNFGSPENEQIITEAYERVGVIGDIITQQKIDTALRSINLILSSWINEGLNLFTVKQGMLSLTSGQSSYVLPDSGVDILEATVRTSSRNLGGTPASSAGGTAAFAFDNNPATSCAQNAPNGNISYSWGNGNNTITMLGVMSYVTASYTLMAEYFQNGIWLQCPQFTATTKIYAQNQIVWFVIPVAIPASAFRIRETGGATLNIAELYFNTNVNDTTISRISRDQYIAIPNKMQTGTPSSFWVDRQINPVVYLWLTPNATYNNMYYTFIRQIQDVGSMVNTAEIPARFLEPLASDLSANLAMKEGKLDRFPMLDAKARQSFIKAGMEDRDRAPLNIAGSYQGTGRGR